MEFKDYYRIMGVARDATQDEIKRAYRQLARKYHPDVSKSPDGELHFKELGEAYAVLKDLEKRAAYDQLGNDWKAGQEFRPPPDWNSAFEFSGDGRSGRSAGESGSDFSDFFESIFGRGSAGGTHAHAASHVRGVDHHAMVLIDLEDAYTGATRTITLQRPEADSIGHVAMRAHKLNVTIPRGIRAGQHIRLAGQGAPGVGQGKPGDLYLEIGFNLHALFRVAQRDVYLDLPVAPWEASLGTKVSVPTPSGVVELTIPAGSIAGGKLRLKGRGIPGNSVGNSVGKSAGNAAGDFYVVLQIALPPADGEKANAFYLYMAEQFAEFNPRARLGV